MAIKTLKNHQAIGLIASTQPDTIRAQYDNILAALSYDWEVDVVFFNETAKHLLAPEKSQANPWKALPLYGVNCWYLANHGRVEEDLAFCIPLKHISSQQLAMTLVRHPWII